MNTPKASLAQRSITSVSWNAAAMIISLPIGFVQSILLARLLPVAVFGIVAGMTSLATLSGAIFEFGLAAAYIHRSPETEDEEQATRVFFTLRVLFGLAWAVCLVVIAVIFFDGLRQLTILILAVMGFGSRFVDAPRTLLDLLTTLGVFAASVLLAVFTRSIWALLISPFISLTLAVFTLLVWKPVWRPHLAWNKSIIRYFLNFGGRTVVASVLGVALDHVDDLWTNLYLGDLKLGYYSRAFKFALYPRSILADPVYSVATATYAELKYKRQRLSQAFFRINALLIRSGFLLGGWLAIIAPHFIRIFLGDKWMPMVDAFRLMLLYTLLDPVKNTIAGLLVAVGKPEKISFARVVQLLVLLIGLFTLGFRYQIAGVALAVDLMLLVGIVLLLFFVNPYVDFSLPRLFLVPVISLIVGIGMSWLVSVVWSFQSSDWLSLIVKSLVFTIGYLGVLLSLEGRLLYQSINELVNLAELWVRVKSTLTRLSRLKIG
jgi:O-antigen/teichoic acid export membrane protein